MVNVLFYNYIPAEFVRFIAPFVLLIIGIIIETKYVSRIAMFTNAAALYIFYFPVEMSLWLGLLINAIIIIGLIGGIARLANISLPKEFYTIAWISSSFITAILLIYGLFL